MTEAKFQDLLNEATCSTHSTPNYVKFPVFQIFFERKNKGELKIVNINYKKWTDLVILPFH